MGVVLWCMLRDAFTPYCLLLFIVVQSCPSGAHFISFIILIQHSANNELLYRIEINRNSMTSQSNTKYIYISERARERERANYVQTVGLGKNIDSSMHCSLLFCDSELS